MCISKPFFFCWLTAQLWVGKALMTVYPFDAESSFCSPQESFFLLVINLTKAFFFLPLPPLMQTEAVVFSFLCGNICFNFLCNIQFVLFYIIYFDLSMSLLWDITLVFVLPFPFIPLHLFKWLLSSLSVHLQSIPALFQCRTCLVFSLKHNRKQKQCITMKPDSSASWFSFYKRLTGCVGEKKSISKCIVCLREAAT